MARPAVHLVTILLAVISEFCILPTRATFYIELVERSGPNAGALKLFECPNAPSVENSNAARPQKGSNTNVDIICNEVVNDYSKIWIYGNANFFAIIPRLNGDRKIKVGGSVLSSAYSNTFLGVTLRAGETDWPVFVDDGRQAFNFMTRQIGRFLTDVNMKAFVTFMIPGDYGVFFRPTREITASFKEYAKVMENVRLAFATDAYNRARFMQLPNNARVPSVTESLNDTQYAIHFLLQKMIDPCFSAPNRQEPGAADEAKDLCNKQCTFLSVAYSAYPGHDDADCSRAIAFGVCLDNVCKCATRIMTLGCACNLKYSPMIKCSNALRTGITSNNRS